MPLKGLFKGDGGGGRDGGSSGGGSSSRDSSTHGGRDSKLMSKAKALLATAAAPLSARGRDRASDRPYFNPEEHISEKREWSRRYTQSQGGAPGAGLAAPKPPDRLYEHFAVVGLPPTMNIKAVAADIKTFQRLSREAGGLGGGGAAAATGMEVTADTPREEKQRQYGLKGPAHPAEVLYSFPAAMPSDLEQGLAAFCFPHGVRPELLERTPSMSALNEVIYSQPYQTHDDHSFVFTMKVVDPGSIAPRTLYGVCCYVRELVHRPPSMAREAYAGCNAPLSRYLVVAPRCYCLLTHHPFFALHFRVLQTILGLERLERMTSFAAELAGLQEGGQPGASWASSSLASSSVGAGSTASLGPGPSHSGGAGQAAASGAAGGGGRGAAALAAPPTAAPAAAAAAGPRGGETEEEDGSEAGSSRRWTEGSSVVADGQQQGADLAAALLELSLSEQHQLQVAQAAAQPRPSRMAQVSPHCPEPEPGATPSNNRQAAAAGAAEAGAAEAEEEQATTPPDRVQPSSLAAAAGPTPFFTPAGLNSALGTPAGHSRTARWELAAAAAEAVGGRPAAENGIRRALADTLAEAGGSSTGSPEVPGPADAASPAAGAAREGGAAEAASASGSRRGSAQQQQQEGQPESDDGSSDAESYLTASSSTALLAQQAAGLDASPATAAFLAGSALKAQHVRSVSGTSLGPAAASPAPAGLPLADVGGAEEEAQQQEQQAEEEEAPPLLQLLLDQRPQQASGQSSAAQPPLLDLGDEQGQQAGAAAVAAAWQQQQQQKGVAGLSPEQHQGLLVKLNESSQVTPPKAAPGFTAAPDLQEQQAQLGGQGCGLLLEETPVKEQQLGSGVAVRIVRRSYSSPAQGHGVADTPPRADLLTGSAVSRSARHPLNLPPTLTEGSREGSAAISTGSPATSLLPPAEAQQGTEQGGQQQEGDQQPPAAQQAQQAQQQQQWGAEGDLVRHEVVRVTASNLDMSRPLRSADLLAVYHASVVPRPGQVFEFQPDPGLQTIEFERPDLVEAVRELGLRPDASSLPDIDAAQNLGGWAVAALCRAMSLDNILTFLTAALLERQIVVFCPNAGLLSGVVLSLIPLLLPFHWQCLLLPVLPAAEGRLELMEVDFMLFGVAKDRLELMEAPVPFVLGVLYKTPEVRAKCSSLVRVNVYKDKVKNAGGLPPLPQQSALHDALAGTYAELRKIGVTRAATTRPIHMISDAQQVLAECFLSTLQKYLKGLMADLRAYCITDVSASMERTSVLLKESFVDSFPPRDRPFMRQFGETQMFAVYTDAVLG